MTGSRLSEIFRGLGLVSEEFHVPIVMPIHPRTRKMLADFDIDIPEGVKVIEPLGFMDFLKAESNARLVLTDSGACRRSAVFWGCRA